MDKPNNYLDYINWWNDHFDDKIGLLARRTYSSTRDLVAFQFEHSNEFITLIHQLYNYDSEYKYNSGYDLLMRKPEDIALDKKDWVSFISKVWRKNVVQNTNWSSQQWDSQVCKPKGGWITPSNWFEEIHDIVRTRIVVKYFDGVRLLLDKMCELFPTLGCEVMPDWEAREEGYYAAHLNVIKEYQVPVGLEISKMKISVEIQITTQMKEVITELTHKYYERRRELLNKPDIKWQWDYESEEFLPNYLGHILHYVEGAVMQVRNREKPDDRN
jgi:hypothetical protein